MGKEEKEEKEMGKEGGEKEEKEKIEEEKADTEEDDDSDTRAKSGLTRRQLGAISSKEKEKEKQALEYEKEEHQKRIEKLGDITLELRRAMRVEPLGEDRYHRLYWFFPGGLPGLYLSDRCVSTSVVNPFAVGERIERWSYY